MKKVLLLWAMAIPFCSWAQTPIAPQVNAVLEGKVTDSLSGQLLANVSIQIKGVTNGTISKDDGAFTLYTGQKFPFTIIVSLLGYETKEWIIQSSPVVIPLSKTDTKLDEVVVVGYGTQRKRDITGAISRLSEKEINDRPVTNVVQALQGKVPGVDITSNLRPGGVGQIRIRGNRSINASNEPLYVVDGIPISAAEANAINPKDIASIEVLKDASATAIYGSRGANGVILISYKEGIKGKVSVNYDGSISFDAIHSTTKWMDSEALLNWQRQSYINGGTYTGKYGTAPDPDFDVQHFGGGETYGINSIKRAYDWNADGSVKLRDATAAEIAAGYTSKVPVYNPGNLLNQNWTGLISRTGVTHNHTVSLASATDKSNLYFSAGYLGQDGAMIDQDFKRYSFNLKGNVTPKKWITLGLSANGFYSIQNYGMADNAANSGGKDSYGQAQALSPYAPAFDEEGNILNTNRNGLSAHNVLLNIENATNEYKRYTVLSSANAEIRFTPWLKYNARFGAQYNAVENGSFYGPNYTNPFSAAGTAPLIGYNAQNKRFGWVLENLLTFNKKIGIHHVQAVLLQSTQEHTNNGINIRAQGVTFPTSLWYNLSANSLGNPMGYGTSYSRTSLASYMGRVNYSLFNKYLLTATGRWDGSSVLAPGHKYDFFPSVAVAWKLEEEKFIKSIEWIDQLKLRYGWGVTGNSSVSAYTTSGTIGTAGYVFNETAAAGYKSSSMPNQDLGWEKTQQHNIGLDFSVLKGRLSGVLEVYQSNTSDLLLSRSIPPILGYSAALVNIGKTQNQGVEIALTSQNIVNKDFKWSSTFSWSKNTEKIIELADGKVDDVANNWFIGSPIAVFRDYEYDRLWSTSTDDARLIELYQKIGNIKALPGQVKVKDQDLVVVEKGTAGSKTVTLSTGEEVTYLDNGFGVINDNDKKILGSNRPKWYAGITNTFSYKNLELSFFLQARVGNLYYGALQTYGRREESSVWSEDNQSAKYPQPTTATFTSYNSVRNYTSGSLVSLRYVSLSYSFRDKIVNKWGLNNLQVYGQVLNPFIWGGEAVKVGLNPEDVNGWDSAAEAQRSGQTANTILLRSFVLGLRIGL